MVIFIHRFDYQGLSENPEDIGKTQIIIAKHRNGEIADIDMMFRASEVRFVDMSDTLVNQMSSFTVDSGMNLPAGPAQNGYNPFSFEAGKEFGENTEFM